jgi:cell division transport system permease protein
MASFRPPGSDDLGLRRALSDRLLPLLVAAMVFLAALALAGMIAASALARHWQGGAGALLTVQVPQPDMPAREASRTDVGAPPGPLRSDAVAALLGATPRIVARRLSADELAGILRPWLGTDAGPLSLDLPAVFEVRLLDGADIAGLAARLTRAAPGTLVEHNSVWFDRLGALARSLQASAALALLVVALVAIAVVAVATRAGLAARRDAIEIVYGLGATDRMIAGHFSRRITMLVFSGAMFGLLLAIPLLLGLATLTAPFSPDAPPAGTAPDVLRTLPPLLWALLPVLPFTAACIGWVTAQATVRTWLAVLP